MIWIVLPNEDADKSRLGAVFPWSSCHFERDEASAGQSSACERVSPRERFRSFPVLCPRWTSRARRQLRQHEPGHHGARDIKQLQIMQRRKARRSRSKSIRRSPARAR